MMLYNPKVDLLNDNVYTKFGLILSIHSQDIESKNLILISIKGVTLLQICEKRCFTISDNVDLVNNNVYTKFGLIPSILCKNKFRHQSRSITLLKTAKNDALQSQSRSSQ